MTPNVKISRKWDSSIVCEQRWQRRVWLFKFGLASFLLILCLFRHPACAASAPAAESGEGISVSHISKHPTDVTKGLGHWIWADKTFDRQTCRLWRGFDIPHGVKVTSAVMKMTADDGYQFFLDGRELGQGANWR
ncbi:MAG TPA: hypothetical protein VFF11_05030, partial [Candidatus Binatia bacterium]|nr:hypothetical protein [Candidatus Binatia bacterium]